MSDTTKYTISDLQLSSGSLMGAISNIAKNIEETDTNLSSKLLSNFNTYDSEKLEEMLRGFQCLLVESIVEREGVELDIEYALKEHFSKFEKLILSGKL